MARGQFYERVSITTNSGTIYYGRPIDIPVRRICTSDVDAVYDLGKTSSCRSLRLEGDAEISLLGGRSP